jgi:hypothetical protein
MHGKITLDREQSAAYTSNQTFSSLFSPISGPVFAGHLWFSEK